MRYRTKAIELEAVRYDGSFVPDFARVAREDTARDEVLILDTDEGPRPCQVGDYFVRTDSGAFLVRGGSIFEAIFEPAD